MPTSTPPLIIAPMIDRTDRHFRAVFRRISRHTLLTTEMIVTHAIRHGDQDALLGYSPEEHPLSIQLGGDDPQALAECARVAVDRGYDEVDLNVGCPSDRVQAGHFGVCLMAQPELVAACVAAMRAAVSVPVTVKHRIGFDELDRYEDMERFVRIVAEAGADRFTVHARKAWLNGLSPRENRTVPPLRYDDVYRLKQEHPHLAIVLNGGVLTLDDAAAHLDRVDGVMIGRAAIDDPYLFAQADARFFRDNHPILTRAEVALACIPYVEQHLASGGKLLHVARHLLNLYAGQPGARRWRRLLTEQSSVAGAGPEVIERAVAAMPA